MQEKLRPPRVPFWIVRVLSPFYHKSSALGDLAELYEFRLKEMGYRQANRWYWRQALRSIPHLIHNLIYWSGTMFRSYFKITWRNIIRYKVFSFINIFGLAVGMACCILILVYVIDELSYDKFHDKSQRIYRANTISSIGTSTRSFSVVPSVFAPEIADSIPDIESAVRAFTFGNQDIQYKGQDYVISDLLMADPSFFQIFSFNFLSGNEGTALDKPGSIVLTEEMARRIFGDEDPLGKAIDYPSGGSESKPLQVAGIIKNVPQNSHLQFGAVIPIDAIQYLNDLEQPPDALLDPYYCRLYAYFLFRNEIDVSLMDDKINAIAGDKWGEIYKQRGTKREFFLMNITDVHLRSPNEDEPPPAGDITNVYLFSAIALLVLLTACFNFINMSTARSSNRAAEVGIRKVIGSQKGQLIRQFLCESIFLSLFGLAIGVLLVILALPAFSGLLRKTLNVGAILDPAVLTGIVGIVFLTGFVAGSFPAFILSAFDPVKVLKGKMSSASRNSLLRKTLVIFQFSVSIFMIAGILTILQQLEYVRNKDLGFHKDQMVVINLPPGRGDVFQDRIRSNPQVISSTYSQNVPGVFIAYQGFNPTPGAEDKETLRAFLMAVDYDFIQTYGLEVIWGRAFSQDFSLDATQAVVINESAAEILGWREDAIGKTLYNPAENNRPRTVVGVIKNFHHTSLKEEISPIVMDVEPDSSRFLTVRIESEKVPETLAFLGSVYEEIQPGREFSYYFIDDAFRDMYPEEEKVGQIYMSFGLLAIFVACLGLFGLSSFTITQRTKEIGVRKVLGASLQEIVFMLSKGFAGLVLAANLIAWPMAYLIMSSWLQNFAYRISIGVDILLLSGLIAAVVALFTISYQSIKVAVANPADSLRYE